MPRRDLVRAPRVAAGLDEIVQSRGDTVFLYHYWAKQPAHLDVSFHGEVSWSGTRAEGAPRRQRSATSVAS